MSHDHQHHHHGHGHDYAAANAAFFDKHAHEFDLVTHVVERAKRTSAALREIYDFDPETTTMLEFACGTGLFAKALAPYTKSILGVDISQGMVDQFNQRVTNEGLSPEKVKAIRAELKGEPGELDNAKFDVIVCTSAYHHLPSVDEVTKTLVYFLKSGGTLLVVDHLAGHDNPHNHAHPSPYPVTKEDVVEMVPHADGFGEEDMKKVFEGAGLISFAFDTTRLAENAGQDAVLFIAKGVKSGVI